MGKRNCETVYIDGEKLKNEIQRRGLTNQAVSKGMGLYAGYISKAIH